MIDLTAADRTGTPDPEQSVSTQLQSRRLAMYASLACLNSVRRL